MESLGFFFKWLHIREKVRLFFEGMIFCQNFSICEICIAVFFLEI